MIKIDLFQENDWPDVWATLAPVFAAGETYPCPIDINEADALIYWTQTPAATYVARDENGALWGTYYLKPNNIGLASHVANAGYVTNAAARGKGVAGQMCAHSQVIAAQMGFKAMQFNLVVTSNKPAVHLWQKHGFDIIGTAPKAFNHRKNGLTDAYIMYKLL